MANKYLTEYELKARGSYLLHISGIKFLNSREYIYFRIYDDSIKFYNKKLEQVLKINFNNINNCYITKLEQASSSSDYAVKLGLNTAIFGLLGPFITKNKGNVDVLVLDIDNNDNIVLWLEMGGSLFGSYGKDQANLIINAVKKHKGLS